MKNMSQDRLSPGLGKNPRSAEYETEELPTAAFGGSSQYRSEGLQTLTVTIALYISVLWFLSCTARL
jgi:hypothetical protein